jgi:hypothetical protein
MQRFILTGLALWIMPAIALGQGATCMTSAQTRRDQCARERGDDSAARRRCLDQYLNAVDRCRTIPDDPLNPPKPVGNVDPLNPPVERSRPIQPRLNPVVPRTQKTQRPVKPIVRYPVQQPPGIKR